MPTAAKKAGRAAIWLANSIVNLFVIALVLLLVAFSCYALWDSGQVYGSASATQYETYKPTVADEGESFAQLRAINPEVFSWLTVYGTHIDYPVTQSEDNWKYVNTNAKGEYSLAGNIFLDAANAPDYSDFNSILYGHHMEKDTMFGELGLFSEEDYFNQRQYGNLYYGGQDYGLEFFAFLHVDAYDTSVFTAAIEGAENQQQYLDTVLQKAMYTRDIGGLSIQDKIVRLTTCSSASTNGRDIMVAKITDEVYSDAFIEETISNRGTGVDSQPGFWTQIPLWAWVWAPALLVLLLLLFVLMNKRKKRGRRREMAQPAPQNENSPPPQPPQAAAAAEHTQEREE